MLMEYEAIMVCVRAIGLMMPFNIVRTRQVQNWVVCIPKSREKKFQKIETDCMRMVDSIVKNPTTKN